MRVIPFPLYAKLFIKVLFPLADLNEIYAAFGRIIFESKPITPDLLIHEKIHLKQQGYSYWGAVVWWIRYRLSKEFRYRQELEAYSAQLQFLYSKVHKRKHFLVKREIAWNLSHPMYGMATFEQALKDLP